MIYYSNYDLNDENVKLYTDKIKISLRTGVYPKSTFGLRINDENVLSKDFSFIGRIEEDGTKVLIKGKETFVIDKNANIIFSSRYKWISRKEADGIRRFSLEDRFGLLDEKFNIKYIIKEKSGWLGFKDQDDNRILIKLKTKLKLRDFFQQLTY